MRLFLMNLSKFSDGKEYLVFSTISFDAVASKYSNSFIYKIAMSEFEGGKTLPLKVSDLNAAYFARVCNVSSAIGL